MPSLQFDFTQLLITILPGVISGIATGLVTASFTLYKQQNNEKKKSIVQRDETTFNKLLIVLEPAFALHFLSKTDFGNRLPTEDLTKFTNAVQELKTLEYQFINKKLEDQKVKLNIALQNLRLAIAELFTSGTNGISDIARAIEIGETQFHNNQNRLNELADIAYAEYTKFIRMGKANIA